MCESPFEPPYAMVVSKSGEDAEFFSEHVEGEELLAFIETSLAAIEQCDLHGTPELCYSHPPSDGDEDGEDGEDGE